LVIQARLLLPQAQVHQVVHLQVKIIQKAVHPQAHLQVVNNLVVAQVFLAEELVIHNA